MSIETTNIVKRFGSFVALDGVDLRVRQGELVAMLGPSGSGKTTLLRIIAGLDWPDEGMVRFDGEDALHRGAGERGVGFVFQHYALFRHLTVYENVAFGLRVRPRRERPSETQIAERVNGLLEMVQLGWLADRYPGQLSGGQRQRVALARALAIEPSVLLLDEPFGALDAKVRKELRRWLRELHGEINVTSLFVTHDQEEALEVADRVVIVNHGRIEQIGTPADVYERPNSAFVHDFIGESFVVPVDVVDGQVKFNGTTLAMDAQGVHPGGARLFVRPHDVALVAAGEGMLTARVSHVRGFGPHWRVEAALLRGGEEIPIEFQARRDERVKEGETIGIKPQRYRLFPLP